jgi:hypothetical protein
VIAIGATDMTVIAMRATGTVIAMGMTVVDPESTGRGGEFPCRLLSLPGSSGRPSSWPKG